MESSAKSLGPENISASYSMNNVNLKTVKKILEVLTENGSTKRTQLAVKTGMNYERCMRYVNTLKIIKLVEFILNENCCYVIITQTGKEIISLLDYL